MIVGSDIALRDFISNVKEFAITVTNSQTGKIVFHNDMATAIIGGDINDCSLNELMEEQSKIISRSEFLFCDYVYNLSLLEKPLPILAVERFSEIWFISIRFNVHFEGGDCIMAMIIPSKNNYQGNSVYLLDGACSE